MAESAASRARVAERRGANAEPGEDQTAEPERVAVPPRRSPSDVIAAALAALAVRGRALSARVRVPAAARRLAPRGLRARLIVIAVLAGVVGAGAMVGVEAATGAGDRAASSSVHAYLGVEVGAPLLGQSGALVELVVPGGPADDAGVMIGDVITSVGGRTVTSAGSAVSAIDAQHPGASVVFGIERFGQSMTLTVTLGSRLAGSP
jgi:PDZ domain